MKFKKLLSLSAALAVTLVSSLGGVLADKAKDADKAKQPVKKVKFQPLPDLKYRVDTVRLTKENFNRVAARSAAGQFLPYKHTIAITYYLTETDDPRVVYNCKLWNESRRVVMRHEKEHAVKSHIVKNVNKLSRWDRARLAAMNESMAPGGEIIEAIEYHLETGERYPADRMFLWRADSLIMARQKEKNLGLEPKEVDFSDPVIADVILESAVNKFAKDHKRGFYHTRIKNELRGCKRPKYQGNRECTITPTIANYLPMYNQWGALWTYDVKTPWVLLQKKRVDIWNSATKETRERVIHKIDSIVKTDMAPGQILQKDIYEYPS